MLLIETAASRKGSQITKRTQRVKKCNENRQQGGCFNLKHICDPKDRKQTRRGITLLIISQRLRRRVTHTPAHIYSFRSIHLDWAVAANIRNAVPLINSDRV